VVAVMMGGGGGGGVGGAERDPIWVDHYWKIRVRKQRRDIGKYSFVNRSITDWNQLPEGAIGPLLTGTSYLKGR
jgi:hypothetical protein